MVHSVYTEKTGCFQKWRNHPKPEYKYSDCWWSQVKFVSLVTLFVRCNGAVPALPAEHTTTRPGFELIRLSIDCAWISFPSCDQNKFLNLCWWLPAHLFHPLCQNIFYRIHREDRNSLSGLFRFIFTTMMSAFEQHLCNCWKPVRFHTRFRSCEPWLKGLS